MENRENKTRQRGNFCEITIRQQKLINEIEKFKAVKTRDEYENLVIERIKSEPKFCLETSNPSVVGAYAKLVNGFTVKKSSYEGDANSFFKLLSYTDG